MSHASKPQSVSRRVSPTSRSSGSDQKNMRSSEEHVQRFIITRPNVSRYSVSPRDEKANEKTKSPQLTRPQPQSEIMEENKAQREKKGEVRFAAANMEGAATKGVTEMTTAQLGIGSRRVKLPSWPKNSTPFQFASSSLELDALYPEFVNSQQHGISCF